MYSLTRQGKIFKTKKTLKMGNVFHCCQQLSGDPNTGKVIDWLLNAGRHLKGFMLRTLTYHSVFIYNFFFVVGKPPKPESNKR